MFILFTNLCASIANGPDSSIRRAFAADLRIVGKNAFHGESGRSRNASLRGRNVCRIWVFDIWHLKGLYSTEILFFMLVLV